MSPIPAIHRFPRARLDPIDDPLTALLAVSAAAHRPLRPESIALLLDDARCGITVAVVTGTDEPDDVVGAVECLARALAASDEVAAMVVASVRPTRPTDADPRCGDRSDCDRWLEMSDLCADAGLELVEWFVIGDEVSCPRDRLGEPPRW